MGFFDRNFQYDPILVNLAQNLEYVPDYHVGTVDTDDVDEGEELDTGDKREQVRWTPKDATDSPPDIWPTSIKKGNMVTFPPGSISPRAVVWLLPDRFSELPEDVKRSDVGLVLSEFYKNKEVERALQEIAENEPEIMDKIRAATQPGELDDQVSKRFNQLLDSVEKAANVTEDSSSSSED